MNAAIAQKLNVLESAIIRVEEWAHVLFVVVRGLGARFVSKKIVEKVMKGTEKQIPVALKLQEQRLGQMEVLIAKAEKLMALHELEIGDLETLLDLEVGSMRSALALGNVRPQTPEKTLGILQFMKRWMTGKDSAKWWIDNGDFTLDYLVSYCAKHCLKSKANA